MWEVIKSHHKRFRKFSLVGVVNTIVDLGIFTLLVEVFDLYPMVAHVAGFAIALFNSFVLNTFWTFSDMGRGRMLRRLFVFFMVGLGGMALSSLTIFIVGLYVNIYIAKLCAMFSSMLWNYMGSYLFVFKHK